MLSAQAILVGVVLLILQIIMLISLFLAKAGWLTVMGAVFGGIIVLALWIYDTNCLTAGNCGVWSWIRTIFVVLIQLWSIIMAIVAMVAVKQLKK
jgi:hypothetical protein